MTIPVRAPAEFVEPRAAERAVRGVPPDEVRDRRRRCQEQAQREEQEGKTASHGQRKYSTPAATPRRTIRYSGAFRLRSMPTARMSRPLYVPHTGHAWCAGRGARHWGKTTSSGTETDRWLRRRLLRDVDVFFLGNAGTFLTPFPDLLLQSA